MNPKGQDLEPEAQEFHPLPSRSSANTGSSNPSHSIAKVETREEVEHTQHHQQEQRISEEDEENPNSNAHRVTSSSHSQTVRHTTSKTTEDAESRNDGGVRRVTSSQTIRHTRACLGLRPAAPINEEEQIAERQGLWWSRVRVALREPFSEFFGVVTMMVLGNASVAQVLLSAGRKDAPGGEGYGTYQSINWGWGVGVMLGLYVAGDSGAYLNPAITFSNCLFRQLPWRRFPSYVVAQLLGAFVGSGIVYANYINAIDQYEGKGIRTVPPNEKATATIFCTFPQPFVTKASQFFSEFIASAILVLVVFALRDPGNNGIEKDGKWFPLMMMFLIFALGTGWGWNTGYAINPARDLGPRILATFLGYGSEMWTAGEYYFWIPIVAPFCGCVFGGLLYDVFIYTGASPINTPWLGLKHIFRPGYGWSVARERYRKGIEEGLV
ncbi:aquaporin [Achaetomium macrosporum]|uniref:Aquaporin n=1 Tax=Achaetomium macrosporum TaxID=79813 RepID=A0AAN7H976_9PEZI|nr:aquaporin [Achaetomium macrosporum]